MQTLAGRRRAAAVVVVTVGAALVTLLGTVAPPVLAAVAGSSGTPPTGTGGGITPPADVSAAVAKGPTDVVVSYDPSVGVHEASAASSRAQGISDSSASYAQSKRDAQQHAGAGVRTARDFDHLPVQLVQVDDTGALDRLASDPHVVGLTLPRQYHAVSSPNLDMIKQPDTVASGYAGSGVTVAVIDTGVDLSHGGGTVFGNCSGGAGTGTCRVKVAHDVSGSSDADTTTFHGTNVAGIVTTVAPAANIDDYGVFTSDGHGGIAAQDTDILNALNSVAGTAASHNIRSVNLSLEASDDYNTTACTSSPFASSFSTLVGDKVIPVVAAGNDAEHGGFHEGVSDPACAPNAFAVGAVYDQSFASVTYTDCTDHNPQPGDIPCFSQTGQLLDVLAPGTFIAAAGVTLTGTSQATPHVAGGIADLVSASSTATVAQIESAITTHGTVITDTRPTTHVARHLLDLADAANALGGMVTTTTSTSTTTTSTSTTTTTTTATSTTTTTTQPPTPATVTRIAGNDRIGTSIKASQSSFPSDHSAGAVVLASSQTFPDGLAGTPLAVHLGGPLLLTDPASIRSDLQTEITRVLPSGGTIDVLGGTGAVGDAAITTLQNAGFQVHRVAGADRYATATAIADAVGSPQVVLLATGLDFPDALTAGVAAAHAHGVVLFTNGSSQAAATQTWLDAHSGVLKVTVGGPASSAVPGGTVLAGADRYITSVDVADHFFSSPTVAGLASGTVFPDALSGGAHVAELGGPMLLTQPSSLPSSASTWFHDEGASLTTVFVYGGTGAVADAVATQVRSATS